MSRQNQTSKLKAALIQAPINPKVEGLPLLVDEYNLCNLLGYNGKYPWFVIRHTEQCYHKFWINKDTKQFVHEFNPELNLREINAPAPSLKVLQGRLAALLFNKLPKHPSNYAFMQGKNIRDAAENHTDGEVLIRIDMKNFFTMHNELFVRRKLHELTGYNKELCWFITKICSYEGCLPQGSVTSPILSVILNYKMDEMLNAIANKYEMVYTRYADDLCFSGKDKYNSVLWEMIREVSAAIHPFKVNWKKVDIMRNKAYRYLNGVEVRCGEEHIESVCSELTARYPDMFIQKKKSKVNLVIHTEMKEDVYNSIVSGIKDIDNYGEVKKHYYYVQDIMHILGINLTDGIKYPRAKYLALRKDAFLIGKGEDIDLAKFRGRLNFMRMIDPNKAQKIEAIIVRVREGA